MFSFKGLKRPQINTGFSLLASLLCVSLGAPFIFRPLACISGAIGFALFWHALFQFSKKRFLISFCWFALVQLVQLSWLARTDYLGPLILGIYALVSFAIALQFAILSSCIRLPMGWGQAAALSGLWVFFEWMRLFPLGGFPWNPVALVLSLPFSVVCASLFGVFGLSFWVMFTNLIALRKKTLDWAIVALAPYAVGLCLTQIYHQTQAPTKKSPFVAIVQPALLPDQKYKTLHREDMYVPALIQWDRLIELLKNTGQPKFDWIIFPEAAVPFGVDAPGYTKKNVESLWTSHFGLSSLQDLPKQKEKDYVSNAFWIQSIAAHFDADVIAGLDDKDENGEYNAAFHFSAKEKINRYEKQILIPVAESIPFVAWKQLSSFIKDQFGIERSFTPGKRFGLFHLKPKAGVVICLEEAYGELVRKARLGGAEILISLSNDAWYPRSFLPYVHLEHGRLRAAENGVSLIRSSNNGVTAIVDRFGKVVKKIPASDQSPGVLTGYVPVESHKTLYTFWGDAPILILSSLFLLIFLWKRLLEYRALD